MISQKDHEISKFRVTQILLLISPLITLAVNPWTNFDPISLPKMLVLSCGAFAVLGVLLINFRNARASLPKPPIFLAGSFLFFMTLSVLFSGAPLSQQFWGSFGRNTGYLTYFSLLVIFLAFIWIRNGQVYLRLAWIFVLTSVPMTLYCMVQISGKDPIPWSEFNTFGTLGNINFLSAFLGMTSIGLLGFALDKGIRLQIRLSLVTLAIVDLLIIYSTGSIQGPIIFVVGFAVLLFFAILNLKKFRLLAIAGFLSVSLISFYLLIQALGNSGPLAKIIYQPSVVFRGDYIHAGWEMTTKRPIFGIGMDSYGDWYRATRGQISTLRTGPDRVANTAHNIFLDISSNGGALLGISFVALVLFTLICALKIMRSDLRNRTEFKVIFSVWTAYQIQALVSINQIGVGIWGWAFSGALIGIYYVTQESKSNVNEKSFRNRSKELRGLPMKASHALAGFLGLAVGLTLAAIPLNADVEYRAASDKANLVEMRKAMNVLGATEFHRELVLDFAMRNNLGPEVKEIAQELVQKYPRSFFGWRVLSVAAFSTDQERQRALSIVRELDPFNPDLG